MIDEAFELRQALRVAGERLTEVEARFRAHLRESHGEGCECRHCVASRKVLDVVVVEGARR